MKTGFFFLFFSFFFFSRGKNSRQKTHSFPLFFFFLFSIKTSKSSLLRRHPALRCRRQRRQRRGNAIHDECERTGVVCSVVGVPKSIDNDILLIDRCFGFDTAVEEAQRSLLAAKVEASSAHRGVGLVRLMGRQSG